MVQVHTPCSLQCAPAWICETVYVTFFPASICPPAVAEVEVHATLPDASLEALGVLSQGDTVGLPLLVFSADQSVLVLSSRSMMTFY